MASEGREGDWDCSGCRNRNYAFRSFCNRCKQPRLLVDTKTPKDSKWLPRIGDWICTGCSNNNYASRKNCKKCGKSKEEAAMPAIAMPGMSLPTYAHYVARTQGLAGLKMNFGMPGNLALQQSLLANPNWSYGGLGRYGLHSSPSWPFTGSNTSGISYASNTNQFPIVPKDWRDGDWICTCGFHNYSSRSQCKECNSPIPSDAPSATMKTTVSDIFPTLGTKRLASEEFVNDWDSKRLNAGNMHRQFSTNDQHHLFEGFEEDARCSDDQAPEMYSKYANGNLAALSSGQVNAQSPQIAGMPALLGKGAKQWREGDWMCSNCNNHNFASRTYCNRCKTQKEAAVHPVGAL
ncbi:uncharacterized protein [Typha angustifolia]|uniref:uncharacterized protein n=1 Tax=Typha angustifolia TaxID=59011 RepID=UPI003C2D8971